MDFHIRKEIESDYKKVFAVIIKAFSNTEYSDHNEQHLVNKLRKTEAFIPELSLVAEYNNKIIGHIILTKIKIINEKQSFDSLALAPVSVIPEFQNKGVGSKLILTSHKLATEMGFQSIILLGHEKYYPRFGYKMAGEFGIKLPFDVPEENCMAIELIEGSLSGIHGMVEYPKAFYE